MNYKLSRSFPILYSLSRTGKVKVWRVDVVEIDDQYHILTRHGYKDMAVTESLSSAVKGKNIGKKNETTPFDQAVSEAQSKHQKQLDRNYSETIPESTDDFENIRPMLAHSYEKRKHNIKFPAFIQPKLNGVRCLAVPQPGGGYKFYSRGGKEYTTLGHIEGVLNQVFTNYRLDVPFDGEIFSEVLDFEEISSAVKAENENTHKLQYWIYDLANPKMDFKDRLNTLLTFAKNVPRTTAITFVPTQVVENEEQLAVAHANYSYVYEGTMIRNMLGFYTFDYRSENLQKLKDFIDEEFEIIGGKEATGLDEGTVVFRCRTKAGNEFDVRPVGSRRRRAQYLRDLPNLIGSFLTVKFQNYSEYGVPIFPVGIAIRDYE